MMTKSNVCGNRGNSVLQGFKPRPRGGLFIAFLLPVLIVCVVAMTGSPNRKSGPAVIRAQRFVLTDSSGTVRGELGTVNGFTRLRIGQPNAAAAWVGVGPNGEPRISLVDGRGRPYLELGANKDGAVTFVRIYDPPGETLRLTMEVPRQESSRRTECTIAAFDENGRIRVIWGLNAYGVGSLSFVDDQGRVRTRLLGPDDKESGSLYITDSGGKPVWTAP